MLNEAIGVYPNIGLRLELRLLEIEPNWKTCEHVNVDFDFDDMGFNSIGGGKIVEFCRDCRTVVPNKVSRE